jgi:autotransporter-associated beta strand protein
LNVAAGVEIQNTAKTFRIGKLTGAGALGGNCSFDKSAVTGSNNWNVGNDENWSSTVKVTSNANLVKVGSGRVAWNAANDNTGSTTVKEGELAVSTTTKLGTGMLTVAANAMLTGNNNAYNPLANSSVKINGTIRPGLLESSTVGKIFFDNKNVTISETGTLVITANKNGNSTSLEGVDKLEINGTICINAIRLHTFAVGDSIRLWNANSFTGTPTFEMLNGVTWDTSRISEGILIVKEIDYSSINSVARDVDARNIYDLSGRLVRRNATNTQGLPAGIYVRGGRKIVVK